MMIYFVRHGQTDWNKEKRIQGRKDIPLNETGIKMAKEIAKTLSNVKFDVAFSSPLTRTLQTAQEIYKGEIKQDKRIIERDNGEYEGLLHNEIKVWIDFNDPNENRFGIENILDFRNRILDFLTDICTNYKDKNVLVATHSGVLLYIRAFFEGEPENNDFSKYKLQNCEVIKYDNNDIEKFLKNYNQ